MFGRLSMLSRSGNHLNIRPLCFGKLPLGRDFLKSRGGLASRSFQAWIDALDRFGGDSRNLPYTQRVLFIPEKESHFVVATIWSSSDQGGGRVFPFSLYCELPQRFLEAHYRSPILASLKIWRRLEQEQVALADARSTAEFYERLRHIEFSASLLEEPDEEGRHLEREALAYSVKNFAAQLFGEERLEDWIRLLWRLCSAIRPGTSSRIQTIALKLPLATGIPYGLQVDSWLSSIRQQAPASSLVPSAIFPQGFVNSLASFALYFRPLRESDVRLLRAESNSDLLDLTVPDPNMDVTGYTDFQEAVIEWLDRSDASLRNLLPDVRWTPNGTLT